MPLECSVCASKRVADIHAAVDAGGGVNATARAFGLSPTALKRHLAAHRDAPAGAPSKPERPPSAPPPPAAPSTTEPDLPLDDVEGRARQLGRAADRLRAAAESGTLRERGAALGEARRTIESMADLVEKLNRGREVALLKSPEWSALRGRLLGALVPFPEARAALIETLERAAS